MCLIYSVFYHLLIRLVDSITAVFQAGYSVFAKNGAGGIQTNCLSGHWQQSGQSVESVLLRRDQGNREGHVLRIVGIRPIVHCYCS